MADHFYDWVSVASPSYSNFDLSYAKYFTTDFFRLIPVCCEECYPGDKWTIGNRIVVRFQPMFAPVMADISVRVHYFFVPYRLLWNRSHDAPPGYTGGAVDPQTGFSRYYCNPAGTPATVSHVNDCQALDGSWSDFFRGEVSLSGGNVLDVTYYQPRFVATKSSEISKGTLWDYFGFPTVGDNGDFSDASLDGMTVPTVGAVVQDEVHDNWPTVYPWASYNLIFNEYYRDENYYGFRALNGNSVANCAYAKDYFTSALPYQQKGAPIALPVSTSLVWDSSQGPMVYHDLSYIQSGTRRFVEASSDASGGISLSMSGSPIGAGNGEIQSAVYPQIDIFNHISATSTAFDIADLRFAFQVQKFLERSARGGTRLTEFLRVHYGVSPRDERLQRPEYIGGTKQPIIVSEVLQTGATEAGSPQGTMAGHAISVDSGFAGSYYCTEPGLIMGIMSIVPKAHYQQGIDRAWLRRSRYDYYFPEFQNLSEQGVERGELYFSGVKANDETIIGYQGRFNELRTRTDRVCGDFRDILDYWHLGRKFAHAPAINSSFIYGTSEDTKRIFAVQDEDPILVSFGNLLRARRPLVKYPEPGLIDHH